jgi:hypothetical protein
LNYFKAREEFSSGVVEGLNNKAKVVIRRSYGFRTFRVLELALYYSQCQAARAHPHPQILLTGLFRQEEINMLKYGPRIVVNFVAVDFPCSQQDATSLNTISRKWLISIPLKIR